MTSDQAKLFNLIAELGGSDERLEPNTSVFINAPLLPGKATRAVSDVPELVRYDLDFHGSHGEDAFMNKIEDGEYVLHSQAAAIIAEERMKLEATAKAGLKLSEELESVKAELAHIKAQEPVGSYEIENGEVISTTDFGDGKLPYPDGDLLLYAAPVDQTAEIERLRGVISMTRNHISGEVFVGDKRLLDLVDTALSGKEPL